MTLIGVCGRNQSDWPEADFQLIKRMKAGVVKMMTVTRPHVFARLTQENPDTLIITRLYDDRLTGGHNVSPFDFSKRMTPIIAKIFPYCKTFQIHNEPNHRDGIEGWGCGDSDAVSFARWFNETYDILKAAFPTASFGFPGLALPDFAHRDWRWLNLCASAIKKADWLGCHCYWQSPPGQGSVMNHPNFGLNYEAYHDKYPDKDIHILECGNSNTQNDYPLTDDDQANQYYQWSSSLPAYVASASFFIASSPDPTWDGFAFRQQSGHVRQVVDRLALYGGRLLRGQPSATIDVDQPRIESTNLPQLTNQQVINIFSFAARGLGLGQWAIMVNAGVDLVTLVNERQSLYTGPDLTNLSISKTEQHAVNLQLAKYRKPRKTEPIADGDIVTRLAASFGIEPAVAKAVLRVEAGGVGFDSRGRVKIRFENHIFFDKWGITNTERFNRHFVFNISKRWTGHKWRQSDTGQWLDCHTSQDMEYQVLNFASRIDDRAAKLSISMGIGQIMGFNYQAAGYSNPQQMLKAFEDKEEQVMAFFRFVVADSRRLDAMKNKDWREFALRYNGSGAVDVYAPLLAKAYEDVLGE